MASQYLLNALSYTATKTHAFYKICTFFSASFKGLYPRYAGHLYSLE